MFSVADLLDRAKDRAHIDSDYRLAKVIGITQSAISSYRMKKTMPDEKILEQICALSGDDLAVVAAQIQAERARTVEGKNVWLMIAKRLAGSANTAILSVVFTALLIASIPGPVRASTLLYRSHAIVSKVYIVSGRVFVSAYWFAAVRLRQISVLARLSWLAMA